MKFIKCESCGYYNEIKNEYQFFCNHCDQKLSGNYSIWLKNNPGKTFEDYKALAGGDIEKEKNTQRIIGKNCFRNGKGLKPRKSVLLISLFTGIFFSFGLYSFLYIIRETIRYLSITDYYDLWLLSDREVWFYNFIYALISTITGLSIALFITFNRPRKIHTRRNFLRSMIVNDQQVFIWYFLFCFLKLAFFYGILFAFALNGGFYIFSFYPKYNFVFIIIVFVLFLYLWMNLRRVFRNKSLKYMLISAVSIVLLSLLFSNINLIDYKALNQISIEKCIERKFSLKVPTVTYNQLLITSQSLNKDVFFVSDSIFGNFLYVNEEKYAISGISDLIENERANYDEEEFLFCRFKLFIDQNVRMKQVNEVISGFAKSRIYRLNIAVTPESDTTFPSIYNSHKYMVSCMSAFWESQYTLKLFNEFKQSSSLLNRLDVFLTDNGKCIISNDMFSAEELSYKLNTYLNNQNTIVFYHINDNAVFKDFLTIALSIEEIIYDSESKLCFVTNEISPLILDDIKL